VRGTPDDRSDGKSDGPGDEGPLPSEQVADPTTDEEKAAEGQGVARDDPLSVVVGELKRTLGRGKGDVDH
jgi:hypothetical protein